MKKSVYSLLLSDDFIGKIDELAAVSGVSRSVMVDRVLAHYLAEETVEMKMNGVFRRMEEMLGNYVRQSGVGVHGFGAKRAFVQV